MTFAFANEETHRLNQDALAPKHLLLGLLRDDSVNAVKLLRNAGAEPQQLRSNLQTSMTSIPERDRPGSFLPVLAVLKVIENAIHEARDLGHRYIGTEHLLLGILRDENSRASESLAAQGVTYDEARSALDTMIERGEHIPEA